MMNPYPMIQFTPEEEAQFLASRQDAVGKFRIVAILMTVTSVLSISVGIVIVSSSSNLSFPLNTGSPIWSGVVLLIGAVFGIFLGFSNSEWKTSSDRTKQRCLVIVFYVFAVTSCSFCGLSLGYTAVGAVNCANENSACGDKFSVVLAMNIIALLAALILLICCIIVCVMFCYYRRPFQFYGRQDQMWMMGRLLQQTQQQNGGQGQTNQFFYQQTGYGSGEGQYMGQQTAYGIGQGQFTGQQTGYGMNFSPAPPPYVEVHSEKSKY